MLALSTSFYDFDAASPDTLVRFLADSGIQHIEMDYRITPKVLPGLQAALKTAGIATVSVHNICPVYHGAPPGIPANTFFHLAEPDKEIRRQGVELARRTLELAHAQEARAVVVHCGWVEMAHAFRHLVSLYQQERIDTPEAGQLRQDQRELLHRKKPKYRDALFFSLERLLEIAAKYDLTLGLENRFHYYELPGLDDFPDIFREFAGAPLGYWHDTGHAWVNEQLGFHNPGQILEALGDHLVGMHVHDARGLDDHLPPGSGEMDLAALADWLGADRPVVVELAPGTALDEAARGVDWVRTHLSGAEKNQDQGSPAEA